MTTRHPTTTDRRTRQTSHPAQSEPVLWWQLIGEMEDYTARTGWGLAGTWALVHAGNYTAARARFDNLLGAVEIDTTPTPSWRIG